MIQLTQSTSTPPSSIKPAAERCRVLLIEDNRADAFLVQQLFGMIPDLSVEFEHALSLGEAITKLKERVYDIVILDLGLPDSDEMEGIEIVRATYEHVPIIVLTSQIEADYALMALDRGAQDYLLKDEINPLTLGRSIRYAQERQRYTRQILDTAHEKYALQLQVEGERYIRHLVSDIQHEFRTPLTTIKTAADLINKVRSPEMIERKHAQITQSIDRLVQITEYITQLAQISNVDNPFPSLLSSFELKLLIEAFNTSSSRIEVDIVNRFFVQVEKKAIVSVLDRLIANALMYSPEASPVVVRAEQVGETIEIKVIDQGIGIAKEDHERIFLPFFKVCDARNSVGAPSYNGGLGLSIAQATALAHGGQILVESELDQGSTFTLKLTAATDHYHTR